MEGAQREPSGCGVNGCLFAAVAFFIFLVLAMIVVSIIRFSRPPVPRFGMDVPALILPHQVTGNPSHPAAALPGNREPGGSAKYEAPGPRESTTRAWEPVPCSLFPVTCSLEWGGEEQPHA